MHQLAVPHNILQLPSNHGSLAGSACLLQQCVWHIRVPTSVAWSLALVESLPTSVACKSSASAKQVWACWALTHGIRPPYVKLLF